MLYVNYQNTNIPKLGYGTWQLEGDDCIQGVGHALEVGFRHVDTAQAYENEEYVGRAISQSAVAREDIFLTTKIWRDNVAASDLEPSLDESLKKLDTDYVDMLLIHWPVEEVAYEKQMQALSEVQRKGKARLVGISNFPVEQMQRCVDELEVNLATNQVEFHPYIPQGPVLSFLRDHGMFLTAYSPLGRSELLDDPVIKDIATRHDKQAAQVILRWHMQTPDVVAIPKASSKAHIESNFNIFDFELSHEEMERISSLKSHNKRFVNPDFAPEWDTAKAA